MTWQHFWCLCLTKALLDVTGVFWTLESGCRSVLMTPISGHYQNNAKKEAQRSSLASFSPTNFLKIIIKSSWKKHRSFKTWKGKWFGHPWSYAKSWELSNSPFVGLKSNLMNNLVLWEQKRNIYLLIRLKILVSYINFWLFFAFKLGFLNYSFSMNVILHG